MYLTQVLDDVNRAALIDLFGVSVVYDVEAALSEKAGKPYPIFVSPTQPAAHFQ